MAGPRACFLAICFVVAGCHGPQSMFDDAGPEADAVVKLWWVLFGVGLIVLVAVSGFLLVGCHRGRRIRDGHGSPASDRSLGRALTLGTLATIALLFVLLVATHRSSQPFADERDDVLFVEVTGKRWWWAVTYRNEAGERLFETANEIHIPAGVPVRLRLRSDNVIHSFWVPALGGKVDMIPGRTNSLWLEAKRPGVYRGQCAEYCGLQHAKMSFFVVASPAEEFESWMRGQEAPAVEPQSDVTRRGREVFRTAGCAKCHTVRGTAPAPPVSPAPSVVGPDLTHLASRRSLAAATLPNRHGHLAGWITDPQSIKPGSLMPRSALVPEDLHALVDYLETLE